MHGVNVDVHDAYNTDARTQASHADNKHPLLSLCAWSPLEEFAVPFPSLMLKAPFHIL